MHYATDYLRISFPFMSPCLKAPSIAKYRFKIMQRPCFKNGQEIRIIKKGDPIGTKGRTSQQNVIYVNFGIQRTIFEAFIEAYINKTYNATEDIKLSWEKGNEIKFIGED